jgi:hypothetical protein
VDRDEFAVGIIILFVSRHISPLLTNLSLLFFLLPIWRYYHVSGTFSTASTFAITGVRKQREAALVHVRVDGIVWSQSHSIDDCLI